MSTPYEAGQRDVTRDLESWQELGWTSMQAASQAFGTDLLEDITETQKMLQDENISEYTRSKLIEHLEYCQGQLSRLD